MQPSSGSPWAAPSASTARGTMSPYTHTAATRGVDGSDGSGVIALATSERTLPGVSAPSSVVRSMSSMILSSAHAFDVVLIDRVPRPAARCSRPTASTPLSPSRCRRRLRLGEIAAEHRTARARPGRERWVFDGHVVLQERRRAQCLVGHEHRAQPARHDRPRDVVLRRPGDDEDRRLRGPQLVEPDPTVRSSRAGSTMLPFASM